MVKRGLYSFSNMFRAKDWWASKAALLMGLVYLYAAWLGIPFLHAVWLSLLSFCTVVGFAATGYLCNDFFDRDKDALAGKYNFVAGKSPALIVLLLAGSLLLLFGPWLYLPFTKLSALLIGLQLLLFLLYSVRPVRLKERGVPGIVTDALYAHTLPALLSYYTFATAMGKPVQVLPLTLLLLWQFTTGLRNILIHQYDDVAHDRVAMVSNLVANMPTVTLFAVFKLLIGLEVLFSVLFFSVLATGNYWFLLAVGVVLFFLAMVVVIFYNPGFSTFINTRWRYFPNPVFEKWLPVVCLVVSAVSYRPFLLLIPMHLLVFNPGFFVQINNHIVPAVKNGIVLTVKGIYYKVIIPVRILFSLALNYLLYYVMKLIFGVDLKQEQVSAWGYIKGRFFDR